MRTMTFQINDASASSGIKPAVFVTITENENGTLSFNVSQVGGVIGDLRGIFFDVSDESILKSLVIKADSNDIRIGDDTIKDLGDGANMNGLTGSDKGYDVGIEVGTAGIGKDDISSYSFTLGCTVRSLTLDDFANVDFGARLTSVGLIDGARSDSSKLLENTFMAINAHDDMTLVNENSLSSGNLLANDKAGLATTDVLSVTGWSGGHLGEAVTLSNAEGATVVLNADGSYVVDATLADKLSEGEHLEYVFSYEARNQNDPTSYGTDTATFKITVNGVNDGPEATDDHLGDVMENGMKSGNVLSNDSDIDRLDVLHVTEVNGKDAIGSELVLDSGAKVTMNADGTFTYDTNGAFDYLMTGEKVTDSFQYTISDGHGGSDVANAYFTIIGSGSVEPPPPPPVADVYPSMLQNISNVVLYLDDGNVSTQVLKVKLEPKGYEFKDVDQLKIDNFIAKYGDNMLHGNTQLIGISVQAGQEYPNDNVHDGTAPGEGAFFFLLDGDKPIIEAIGAKLENGGWVQDWTHDDVPLTQQALDKGLTPELLQEQAKIVVSNFDADSGQWII